MNSNIGFLSSTSKRRSIITENTIKPYRFGYHLKSILELNAQAHILTSLKF